MGYCERISLTLEKQYIDYLDANFRTRSAAIRAFIKWHKNGMLDTAKQGKRTDLLKKQA